MSVSVCEMAGARQDAESSIMAGGFVKLVSPGRTNRSATSPPVFAFGSPCQRVIGLVLRPQKDPARAESSVLHCAEAVSWAPSLFHACVLFIAHQDKVDACLPCI